MYERLRNIIVAIIMAMLLLKFAIDAGLFKTDTHFGPGYTVKIPVGWQKDKERTQQVEGEEGTEPTDMVVFIPQAIEEEDEVDAEFLLDETEQLPEAFISIASRKLSSPLWLEDEWGSIVSSIANAGYKIFDKGEIKIDEEISNWVLYQEVRSEAMFLEFYIITERSQFYKFQFTTHAENFNRFRPGFEQLRESFKFNFGIF